MPDTTKQCYISHAATLQGERSRNFCGIIFRKTDVNIEKTMTVTSQIGGRAGSINQEFIILMRTIQFSSHSMASNYSIDPVKVGTHRYIDMMT